MSTITDIGRMLALTGRLLFRFWPQLLLIGSLGYIARALLLDAAVATGMRHAAGGMAVLSLVVLVKLIVVVAMFAALRAGLPALATLRGQAADSDPSASRPANADRMLAVTAAVILPFFAYYAAWGFLGDTVREYSRLALDRVEFGERLRIFEFLQTRSLVLTIAAFWAVRWLVRLMKDRSASPLWRILLVATDASWIFIALYALGKWKTDLIEWIGAGSMLENLDAGMGTLSIAAHAATDFVPVEFRQPGFFEQAQSLFFYSLLPLVWLVMAAIINGYDFSAAPAATPAAPSRAPTWRKWLRDFVVYFVGGYRTRYRPVWACLRMTLGTGLGALLAFVVAYRALGWFGAWLWYGATRMLGPYDLETWQLISSALVILIGSPSDLNGGILLDAARIALLAAMLEHAVSAQGRAQPQPAAT